MATNSGGGETSELRAPCAMSDSKLSFGEMGDISETESETSWMGDSSVGIKPPSPALREQLAKKIDSLLQENIKLKSDLEAHKLRVRTLQQENKSLKQASVLIQTKAEQEEEFISNTLLKKIQELKKEKEALALNYEQEEEFLTNDLSRKLYQLRNEKTELAQTLQQEQEFLVNKLMRKIQKLESETNAKQTNLDQLRREKVELENTLEQEQEALVNKLWKRMDRLEAEKRLLQEKMEQPTSSPPSPMDTGGGNTPPQSSHSPLVPTKNRRATLDPSSDPGQLLRHIQMLRGEVGRLKQQINVADAQHIEKTAQMEKEEQGTREENVRLRRKLELEVERRQELCRHLSESESSLEMEDERHFNELSGTGAIPPTPTTIAIAERDSPRERPLNGGSTLPRVRTISSPNPALGGFHGGRPCSPILGCIYGNGSFGSKQWTSSGSLNVNVSSATTASALLFPPVSPGHTHHPLRCTHCGSLLPIVSSVSQSPAVWPIASTLGNTSHLFRTKSGEHTQQQQQQQGTSSLTEHFVRPANPPTPKSASPAPASPKTVDTMDIQTSKR